ncbi:MAG: PEP-CTERM system TPR-repeat protein PrsT [Thiobacillus sp.]|nr:PEP-CTERM system TPR-repeat protein PrsT [Thiobacillus sp.]
MRQTLPQRLNRLLLPSLLVLGLAACGSEDSAALLKEARAKLAAGDDKAAMIQLKNAVAQDDKNAEARFELGKLYLAQHNFASAEKELRRAREAGFPAAAVNPLLARALLDLGEFQRVVDELPVAASGDPAAATLQALRATAELRLGRKEDARKSLRQASETAPDNADVQLALAQLALADNDAAGAMQALDEALRIDPKHRDSLLLKADLLLATGKPAEAVAVYRNAIKTDPQHIPARLALAGIALADNKLADARREVDAALQISPNNLQARYTQALIDFRDKKTETARDHLAPVLKAAPDFVPAQLLAGAIEYTLGNMQTAEAHLNKVVKTVPDNPYASRLLAAAQLRQGRPDDAAKTLAPALKAASVDAGVLAVAGEIAQAKRDFAQASAYFEQAAKQTPDNAAIRTSLGVSRLAQGDARAMADLQTAAGMEGSDSRADTFIILNQLQAKQFDAALASIAALEKKQGASPLTWNYRAAAQLGKGDAARARASFTEALKLDPKFFPAAANLAQLDLQDKQPAAAKARFDAILKADPKHLNAMLALADLALRDNDEKTYVGWLEKAATAHPQALPPRFALARYQLAKGSKTQALATAREAANAQPDNPAALDLLGTTQLATGDATNAIASYRKLAERQPDKVPVLIKLASAQIVGKDFDAARKTLQKALQIEPDAIAVQQLLGGVEIQSQRFDEAMKLARQMQKSQPKNVSGLLLEAQTHYARRNHPEALAAYQRAYALDPSAAILIQQLQVYTAMQQSETGEKQLVDWLAANPKDHTVRAALAESLMKRRQHAAASKHYLILADALPNNLLVFNNLAWALAELGDKRAPEFAERAYKLAPQNPAAADTLGWALLKTGQATKSLDYFKKALQKTPDNPDIQYHHALAMYQTGDTERARNELRRILAGGLQFEGEPEARALLNRLDRATSSTR